MATRWRIAVLAAATALLNGPVAADCVFCDRIVVMNSRLAGCFAAQVEASLALVADGTNPFALVDLSGCAGREDAEKGPVPRSEVALKTSFILDEDGMLCLKALLEAEEPALLNPSRAFDLGAECR